MSESPMSASDQEEWAAAEADARLPAAAYCSPTGMSRVSSYEDYWTPVYGMSPADGDLSPAAPDAMEAKADSEADAAGIAEDSSSRTGPPEALPAAASDEAPQTSALSENISAQDAVDAELDARLAALSHQPAAASSALPSTAAASAQPAAVAAGDDRDLAQVLREAEARFAAASQQEPADAASAQQESDWPDTQLEPEAAQQAEAPELAADGAWEAPAAAYGQGAECSEDASVAEAAESAQPAVPDPAPEQAQPAADGDGEEASALKQLVPDQLAEQPPEDAVEAVHADAAAAPAASQQQLPAGDDLAAATPAAGAAQEDQAAAQTQQATSERSFEAEQAAGEVVAADHTQPLERQEGGSGSFSFPAPAAIAAAAAANASPRGPPAVSEDTDAVSPEAAPSAAAAQPNEQLHSEPAAAAAGQAATTVEDGAPTAEQAAPQTNVKQQTTPMPVPRFQGVESEVASQTGSPAAGSPASNGSYDRAAERRKREERQAALEAQRKVSIVHCAAGIIAVPINLQHVLITFQNW